MTSIGRVLGRLFSAVWKADGALTGWLSYAVVTVFIACLTVLLHPLRGYFELVNIALLYLLPVLISAVKWGLFPAFFAAVVGLIAFDWFFVPPYFSFAVSDLRYLISFAVFLTVATLTASLASRLRTQLKAVRQREVVTSALYTLSRQMTAIGDLTTVLQTVVQQMSETVGTEVAIFLPNSSGELQLSAQSDVNSEWETDPSQLTIVRWVFRTGEKAGRGTRTLRETPGLYIPLKTEEQTHGVIAVNLRREEPQDDSERFQLIDALARLAAVAIDKVKLAEEAKVVQLMAESERLRTAILDSLSHELRTPLAMITGAITGLIESGDVFTQEDRNELLETIRDGSMRMNRLVINLLGMVRLESGMLRLHKRLCDIEDLLDVVLKQVEDTLQNRKVRVLFEPNIPRVPIDDILIEQVLVNILSNAIKYSPDASDILVSVRHINDEVKISVTDQGVGIPKQDLERIFEKFHRSRRTQNIPGTGLGLAICKGIVEAHGGKICVEPNREIGTTFTICIPDYDTTDPK